MDILPVGVDIIGPFFMELEQLKFMIVGVDYFIKWINAVVFAKITTEGVCCFY